jgi:ATP-dependent exoDNAse (exonuclease V) beta subunit
VYAHVHTALLGQCVHQLLDELPCQERHTWASVAMSWLQRHGFSAPVSHLWTTRIMTILTKEEWAPLFAHPHSLAEVDMSHQRQVRRMDRLLVHDHDAWIVDFKTSSPLDMTHWDQCAYGQQLNEYHQWVQRMYPDKWIHTGLLWVKTGSLVWKPTPYPFRLWSTPILNASPHARG